MPFGVRCGLLRRAEIIDATPPAPFVQARKRQVRAPLSWEPSLGTYFPTSVQCGNKGHRADFPQNGHNSQRCAECGLWRPFRRIDAWLRDDSSAKRRCSQRNRYTTITTNGITVLRTRIITTRFQELLEPPTARTSAAVCTVDDAMSHTSHVPRRRAPGDATWRGRTHVVEVLLLRC